MLDPYRPIDLYPHKYGVQPVIHGYLSKYRPWYFDGNSVWWGDNYELRSEAEAAAKRLREM